MVVAPRNDRDPPHRPQVAESALHMLQPYCATVHAATATFARASNTEAPSQPARPERLVQVEGMNWNTPDAPVTGFTASGSRSDSASATQRATSTVRAPRRAKYSRIRFLTTSGPGA